MPARQAVAHLAGLQAQAPLAPYTGLATKAGEIQPRRPLANFRQNLCDVSLPDLLDHARALLAGRSLTRAELGKLLAER